jgi:hypothetical protein
MTKSNPAKARELLISGKGSHTPISLKENSYATPKATRSKRRWPRFLQKWAVL